MPKFDIYVKGTDQWLGKIHAENAQAAIDEFKSYEPKEALELEAKESDEVAHA
jgi:hypothetical protein